MCDKLTRDHIDDILSWAARLFSTLDYGRQLYVPCETSDVVLIRLPIKKIISLLI